MPALSKWKNIRNYLYSPLKGTVHNNEHILMILKYDKLKFYWAAVIEKHQIERGTVPLRSQSTVVFEK